MLDLKIQMKFFFEKCVSLIVIVKAYFITYFSQEFIDKECKKSNDRQRVVLRDSKCWAQALKIKVFYINCFINRSINNRRDINDYYWQHQL